MRKKRGRYATNSELTIWSVNKYFVLLISSHCYRRAKCFLATKQLKSATESFKTTVRALDDSNLSPDERRKRQQDVEATLSTITAGDGKNVRNGKASRRPPVAVAKNRIGQIFTLPDTLFYYTTYVFFLFVYGD